MKPYFLVVYNRIRFSFKHLIVCRGLSADRIQMFSAHTKLALKASSTVIFGTRIVSDGRCVMIVDDQAILQIGSHVYFNEDTMISCKSSIMIGAGCRFGPNVKIFDNNHKFDAKYGVSEKHTSAPILIGENCWIGANVVILKGTTIGKNCVIGAGCVVRGNIPDCSIVTQSRELHIQPIRDRQP